MYLFVWHPSPKYTFFEATYPTISSDQVEIQVFNKQLILLMWNNVNNIDKSNCIDPEIN